MITCEYACSIQTHTPRPLPGHTGHRCRLSILSAAAPLPAQRRSLNGRRRCHWLRHRLHLLQQHPRAILVTAMLGGAQHRIHLFGVNLVVDDEVDLLALAVSIVRPRGLRICP